MATEMQPIGKVMTAANSAYYAGEHPDWLNAAGVHRDSDSLERSNWSVWMRDVAKRYPDDAVIERFEHFAVGWIDELLVRPGSEAESVARDMRLRLDDYPVLDETAWSELEEEELFEYVKGEAGYLCRQCFNPDTGDGDVFENVSCLDDLDLFRYPIRSADDTPQCVHCGSPLPED